jgi:hypothetical protein
MGSRSFVYRLFTRQAHIMNRVDFVDQLPLTAHCDYCVADICTTGWQVAAYGPGQWIGLNSAECPACHSIHVGAAGSTRAAYAEAQKLRHRLLESVDTV